MDKKIAKRSFHTVKRTIKGFIKDEDGFVTKNQIMKIGLGTIGSLGVLSSLTSSYAGTITANPCNSTAHANFYVHNNGMSCTNVAGCQRCVPVNHPPAHGNGLATHINHSSAASMVIAGKGTLSGKGSANLNLHCPPTYNGQALPNP